MARKRKKKKKPEDSGPPGAPEWVVTFTDMISLLVTFFVLLMTFSSIEEFDRLRVDGWLHGMRGNIESIGGHIARETMDEDIVAATDIRRGADHPHSRPFQHLGQNLEEMGQKKLDGDVEMDFKQINDGLQIVFDPECNFAPGSAEVNNPLREHIERLADVLQYYPHLVVVEGFTDDAFKPSEGHATPEALSMARAMATVDVMVASADMQHELLQAAGLGSSRPRGDNETLEGRTLNRRVEVRIIALSKVRANALETMRREGAR